jgi:Flp pilus assembly protein TadD
MAKPNGEWRMTNGKWKMEMHHSSPAGRSKTPHPTMRLAIAGGLLCTLLLLIWSAGRAGFSSLLASYASMTNKLVAANAAVTLSPANPDAHYLRGAMLATDGYLPGAIHEYQEAALHRPDDYVLWLNLARALEVNGDVAGALTASRQAVQLAPYYARPHWQLGNLLLRAGQRDEAFQELSQAGASDPTLLPGTIDLAWQLSGGDPRFVKQAIQPQTPDAYLALAQYFRKRAEVTEAIAMYVSAGSAAEQERGSYLAELISAKRFPEAYALWSVDHPANPVGHDPAPPGTAVMIDPGFEQESNLHEPGFRWCAGNKAQTLTLSLDADAPREGRSSLRVDFDGDSDPGAPVISQLVLVAPHSHYQLQFAARTAALVSGGLPLVLVIDAGNQQVLGQSLEFPEETNNIWHDFIIGFNSSESTSAVQITLQRECSKSPCPIFGRLWLDNFSLLKL